jgi:hypothetical protein
MFPFHMAAIENLLFRPAHSGIVIQAYVPSGNPSSRCSSGLPTVLKTDTSVSNRSIPVFSTSSHSMALETTQESCCAVSISDSLILNASQLDQFQAAQLQVGIKGIGVPREENIYLRLVLTTVCHDETHGKYFRGNPKTNGVFQICESSPIRPPAACKTSDGHVSSL